MWKLIDGRLVHTTDDTRVKFRTNISESILQSLKTLAKVNGTHVNYLLENGLKEVLASEVIFYNKDTRPKDRIQYKTTYDQELLASVKEFAKQHDLYINDVIEYSVQFIDIENIKRTNYRYRVE